MFRWLGLFGCCPPFHLTNFPWNVGDFWSGFLVRSVQSLFGSRTSYHWSMNSILSLFQHVIFFIFLVFFPGFYIRLHDILNSCVPAHPWQIWYDCRLRLMLIAFDLQVWSWQTCPTSGNLITSTVSILSWSYVPFYIPVCFLCKIPGQTVCLPWRQDVLIR